MLAPLKSVVAALRCKKSAYATMDSGYPLEMFPEPIQDFYICRVCGKVLRSPISTPCGHVFCLHCLEFWIEYYGICPKRCGEVDLQTCRAAVKIERRIQNLPTFCKYHSKGCQSKVLLAEKEIHECRCIYRTHTRKTTAQFPDSNRLALSQDSYIEMASRGRAEFPWYTTSAKEEMTQQLTFDLTRGDREPLGFALAAGAKNSNGRAVNFSIKAVDTGSVAYKAGLKPGDKIIQLNGMALSALSQHEAVTKIITSPRVILTILRDCYRDMSDNHHLYEEILYSDTEVAGSTQHQQIRKTQPIFTRRSSQSTAQLNNFQERDHFRPRIHSELTHNNAAAYKDQMRRPRPSAADSGLSSGSSGSPPAVSLFKKPPSRFAPPIQTSSYSRGVHSYHVGREARRKVSNKQMLSPPPSPPPCGPSQESDYDVEEIYLQKNGTNQLGITLGYDTKTSVNGSLFVCEIVADGLAAKDGRIQCGDIIRKVNGFEVYDPEEAVLLFLEQDQDITLTVARRIKTTPPLLTQGNYRHRRDFRLKGSKSHASLFTSPTLSETNLAKMASHIRRTDSCGSLDSHTHAGQEQKLNRDSCSQGQPSDKVTGSDYRPRSASPSKLYLHHKKELSETNLSRPSVLTSHTISSGYNTESTSVQSGHASIASGLDLSRKNMHTNRQLRSTTSDPSGVQCTGSRRLTHKASMSSLRERTQGIQRCESLV